MPKLLSFAASAILTFGAMALFGAVPASPLAYAIWSMFAAPVLIGSGTFWAKTLTILTGAICLFFAIGNEYGRDSFLLGLLLFGPSVVITWLYLPVRDIAQRL